MEEIYMKLEVNIIVIKGTQFVVDERYECHKQIGHGAYGVVCSGVDLIKNKKVAIKKVMKLLKLDLKCI